MLTENISKQKLITAHHPPTQAYVHALLCNQGVICNGKVEIFFYCFQPFPYLFQQKNLSGSTSPYRYPKTHDKTK